MRLYIVAWRAYGDWKSTTPFPSHAAAQKHIDQHILQKDIRTGQIERDYNTLVQIIPIDVSEAPSAVHNQYADFGQPQLEDHEQRDHGLTAATDEEAAESLK